MGGEEKKIIFEVFQEISKGEPRHLKENRIMQEPPLLTTEMHHDTVVAVVTAVWQNVQWMERWIREMERSRAALRKERIRQQKAKQSHADKIKFENKHHRRCGHGAKFAKLGGNVVSKKMHIQQPPPWTSKSQRIRNQPCVRQ